MFSNKRFAALLVVVLFFISNHAMALVSGQLLWERHYGSPNVRSYAVDMSVDKDSNIFVTGFNRDAISTVKYASNGKKLWSKRYSEDNTWARVKDSETDKSGNIFIAGEITSTQNNERKEAFFIIKYDKIGNQVWVKKLDISSWESLSGIAVDGKGNLYICGFALKAVKGENYFAKHFTLVKYNTNGIKKWARYYSFGKGSDDRPDKIAIDSKDNIYVTGQSHIDGPMIQYISTVKYNSNGSLKWTRQYGNGKDDSINQVSGLKIDSQDNVIVAGTNADWNRHNFDYVAIKYNQTGTRKWIRRFNAGLDMASGLALDSKDSIIITGFSGSITSERLYNQDISTVKFDANGNRKWARKFDGQKDHSSETVYINWYGYDMGDAGKAVITGNNDSVYVTGIINSGDDKFDIETIKYDSRGKQRWARRYAGNKGIHEIIADLDKDSTGNILIAGSSNNIYPYELYNKNAGDFTVLKYEP